jgi:uncharacterized protein (TIGR02996 family)
MVSEADFILAILARPHDETLRLVYADWLEERGDARAEFLRKESELAKVRRQVEHLHREATLLGINDQGLSVHRRLFELQETERSLHRRLGELRPGISLLWMNWVDRARIENCGFRFDFQCPIEWSELALTDDVRVRHCSQCDRGVHFCESLAQAREHGEQGHCVAVASTIARGAPDDVPLPRDRMEMGLIDMEAVRRNMPLPRQRLTERALPRPLVERIRHEAASYSQPGP